MLIYRQLRDKQVPDTKGDVFNGNYLYGGLVLKLNSRHT